MNEPAVSSAAADPSRGAKGSVSERQLTSLAILKVNWDRGHDYIENFVPFVAQALSLLTVPQVSLPEIKQILKEEFGLVIPGGALKTILKRAARRNLVVAVNDVYTRNDAALAKLNFRKTQQDVLRCHNTLIEKLVAYCKKSHDVDWVPEEAGAALLRYLARDALAVLSLEMTPPVLEEPSGNKKDDFLIASFIYHLSQNDAPGFNYLETVVKGGMLADAVYFPQIGNITASFDRIEIYFDTNVLLRAMGFAGKVKQDSCRELLDLLYALNANLRCFEHTVEEVRGVLHAAVGFLRNYGRGIATAFETYDYFVSQRYSASDVQTLLDTVPALLSSLRVVSVETPPHSPSLTIDEGAFEALLRDKYHFHKDEVRYRDVRSITAIYRLRLGHTFHKLDSCRAIFVTTNFELVKAASECFQTLDGQVPLCVGDDALATHAWLKKPTAAPDLPRKRLIADCFAALNPPDELWSRYMKEVDRLKQSQVISEEDYAILKCSPAARDALMDATYGESAAFVEGTVQEVLDRAKAAMTEAMRAEIVATEQALSTAEQRATAASANLERHLQRSRNVAINVGRWATRAIQGLLISALALGVYFTFPGVTIPPDISARTAFFPLLLLFSVMVCANLYSGTTVKSILRRVERQIAVNVEKWLIVSPGLLRP